MFTQFRVYLFVSDKSLSDVLWIIKTVYKERRIRTKVEKLYFKYGHNSNRNLNIKLEWVKPLPLKQEGFCFQRRLVFNIIDFEKEHKRFKTLAAFGRKTNFCY
jgi:hypothetical protein